MKNVTISVSIPTYNRLPLLKRTLKSVFNQTEPANEVIVVDNCSNDGTWEYLRSVAGIKAVRNPRNLGMVGNWNRSFQVAASEYVVSLHSDDILLPDNIKTFKQKMAKIKEPVAAFITAGYIIDAQGRLLGIVQPYREDILLRPPQSLKFFWEQGYFYILVSGWTVFRKGIFAKVGYFSEKYGLAAEDEMSFKILANYPVFYSAQPLFAVRSHQFRNFQKTVEPFSLKKEASNLENQCRVLVRYEKEPGVMKAFTAQERHERLFLRRALTHLTPQAFYRLLIGDLQKARLYWQTFNRHYPSPKFSWLTIRLVRWWLWLLIGRRLLNLWTVIKNRRKKID